MLYFGVVLLAIIAYKRRSLTVSGALGACIVGSAIALGLGLNGLLLIGTFFLTSTYWSSYKKKQKETIGNIIEKGDERDIIQVLANGGIPAVIALGYYFLSTPPLIAAFVGSLAAATADTWASEIGVLSKKKPFHIIRFQTVERGISGAVSLLGMGAALIGAGVISSLGTWLWWGAGEGFLVLVFLFTIAGFLGNIVDTILGGTLQVSYVCSVCSAETERKFHCNKKTVQFKGKSYMNNDQVNVLCSFTGALIGLISFLVIGGR
ncbi:DUF92 domain-containing protein [Anaerobacillus sp. MEB173]|uniref:DUF92 domain-containing protein n=1 Tax=Anaerobacillus sp. MEB173 TaxID=3383345 RepID=UPI003F8F0FF9